MPAQAVAERPLARGVLVGSGLPVGRRSPKGRIGTCCACRRAARRASARS